MHFSRWGLLIPLVFICSTLIVMILVQYSIGQEAAKNHHWLNSLIFLLSGMACWLLGRRFPVELRQSVLFDSMKVRTNTFFFIGFRGWSLIFFALMVYHTFKTLDQAP